MILTPGDRSYPLWGKLLEHFNAQLTLLRAKNDGNLDPTVTAGLRGQIAVYKALAALDKDAPDIS